MMVIRPIAHTDLYALESLAKKAMTGLTTLPADHKKLEQKISASISAFSGKRQKPGDDHYMFVLEDTRMGDIVGTSGVIAAVGLNEAFYSYKLGTTVHASRELGVYNKFTKLYLSNDYTGCTELCTLFLDEDYRKNNNGKLLSKCRFLYMAEFSSRFDEKVIAELRGYSDKKGRSLFWEGLGRHFFSMDFSQADFLSGVGNKSFIAELMPKHPVYVNLLKKKTQDVIGKVHEETVPALKMLEKEGFSFQGYVDIFDAGPTVEAQLEYIRAVRYSKTMAVDIVTNLPEGDWFIISNTKLNTFRCCLTKLQAVCSDKIKIDKNTATHLKVKKGDKVRFVSLK